MGQSSSLVSPRRQGKRTSQDEGHGTTIAIDPVHIPLNSRSGLGQSLDEINNEYNIAPNRSETSQVLKFPLQEAAAKGNVKELEYLLKTRDPLELDSRGRTVLHYACGYVYQRKALRMVEAILGSPLAQNTEEDSERNKQLVDLQDNGGVTALHIAARTRHRLIVEKLIFSAADINLKDNKGTQPIQLIYRRVPAAMVSVYDSSIECLVGDKFDENLKVRLNFGSIVGYLEMEEETGFFPKETELLSYCLQEEEHKRELILLHPVVQLFLSLKWNKVKSFVWISILFHLIWLLLYTLFILHLYLVECPYTLSASDDASNPRVFDHKTQIKMNISMENQTMSCKVGTNVLASIDTMISFLFAISLSVAFHELYEMYSSPQLTIYLSQMENYGQWLLIGAVGLTSLPVFARDQGQHIIYIHKWQYEASAIGICLAWSLVLGQVGKLPGFGVYVEILDKVLRSFGKFMMTFSALFVAFVIAFQILLPDKMEIQDFPWGFAKAIVMMTGELSYSPLFYGTEAATEVPFPTLTKLFFIIFVCVVTILLFNLLIGLTVSDIQGLQTKGQLTMLSKQLHQIYLIEKVVVSQRVQQLMKFINKQQWLRQFLVVQQTDNFETNMYYDTSISRIPRDLQQQIRELAAPNPEQDMDDDDDVYATLFNKSKREERNNGCCCYRSTAKLKRVIREVLKEFAKDEGTYV